MKRRAVIEHAVGEDRAAIYEGRRLVELYVDRPWQKTPRTGDQYIGRITNIDPSVAGAWVDIGSDAEPAFSVLRSQTASKGATLRFIAESNHKAGLVKKLNLKERLLQRFPDLTFDEASVNAVDAACETSFALPGGGSITLEQTQALLAIDVDKGSAISAAAAANEAAKLIASQLRLRGLGGLVVIDFPNLRQPKQRKTLERTFEAAFEADPNVTKFNSLSRFGVIEMTRAKPDLSLDDVLNTKYATPSIETQSLRALRRLTREAAISPGAQLELIVTTEINDWLASAPFDWRSDVNNRIGARFNLVTGSAVDVKADR